MTRYLRDAFLVLLLWLAGLGAATQFAKIAVPFGIVTQSYPDHADSIGWLLSIISLIGALLGALSGALAARIGPNRLLIFGLVLGGLISGLQSLLPAFSIMLVSRLIEGVSHLAIVVAAPTLIAQITSGRGRDAAMVLWSSFFGVAFALNAWIGLPFVDRFGLSSFFALHGVLMLLIAGVIGACRIRISIPRAEDAGEGGIDVFGTHVRTYRSPSISAPAIGWFFYTLTFVSLLAILPGRLPAELSGPVAGLMPLAGILLSWLAVPPLLGLIGCVAVINLGFALGILALIAALMGTQIAVVSVVLFAVLGLVQGGSFAAVPQLNQTPQAQALGYGAMAQMGNAGNLLGTPLLLAVLWRTGDAGMLVFVVVIYAAAILAHLWLARLRVIRQDRA